MSLTNNGVADQSDRRLVAAAVRDVAGMDLPGLGESSTFCGVIWSASEYFCAFRSPLKVDQPLYCVSVSAESPAGADGGAGTADPS